MAGESSNDAIAEDLPCMKCGYNLRTRRAQDICPECGEAVWKSMSAYTALPDIRTARRLAGRAFVLALIPVGVCIFMATTWLLPRVSDVAILVTIIGAITYLVFSFGFIADASSTIGERFRMELIAVGILALMFTAGLGLGSTLMAFTAHYVGVICEKCGKRALLKLARFTFIVGVVATIGCGGVAFGVTAEAGGTLGLWLAVSIVGLVSLTGVCSVIVLSWFGAWQYKTAALKRRAERS